MFSTTFSSSPLKPSRTILCKGHRNFANFFPSLKNGVSVGCESYLEAECCLLLEYDRDVTRYHAQPHCYEWIDAEQHYRYTPDFRVHCIDGSSYLIEVKQDFEHIKQTYKDKLVSFSELCRNHGWLYQKWSMAQIQSQVNFDTLRYLYSRSHHIDAVDKFFFIEAAQQIKWPVTLGQLIEELPQFSINLLCHLLFFQTLAADLHQSVTLDFQINGIEYHGQSAA